MVVLVMVLVGSLAAYCLVSAHKFIALLSEPLFDNSRDVLVYKGNRQLHFNGLGTVLLPGRDASARVAFIVTRSWEVCGMISEYKQKEHKECDCENDD